MELRVLIDGPASGAVNMATDHAIALDGSPPCTLRFYGWASPTVSLGRNQPARGIYDTHEAASRGLAFVRRPTGGRAVLHDDEVTYSVSAPTRSLGGSRAIFEAIHRGVATGLKALGVPVERAEGGPSGPPEAGPCFDRPAPGELVCHGRKLVGSAQVRMGRRVLQHGSVLVSGEQGRLGVSVGAGTGERPGITLAEILGHRPEPAVVVDALERGIARSLGTSPVRGSLSAAELASLPGLVERYGDPEWTWRR